MRVLKSRGLLAFVCCIINLLGGVSMSSANQEVISEISNCPSSPNCVSTLTDSKEHKMQPWNASAPDVLKKIKAAALEEPRSKLVSESDTHLQFEFKSFVFRFVDDAWFALKDGKVHFKSAARTGYKDFDKNKERMERIQQKVFK